MNKALFRITYFVLFFIIILSCQKNNDSSHTLLEQAQDLADSDPDRALELLDSIHSQEMDRDTYMQYIVTRIQAKYRNHQSIAEDTLIFEASKYFDSHEKYDQSALAHFYSGGVYYQKNMQGKALKSYMLAEYYARLSKDSVLMLRSEYNIGYQYYKQDIMDSALFHYKRALDYCYRMKNTDELKMQTIYSMGSAFYQNYDLDSAYCYYDKGLQLAEKVKDEKYQGIFINHLGVVDRVKGNYQEAILKLHLSLAQTNTSTDSLRIYLNLSKLHISTEQLDSAHFYTELLKNRLHDITDDRILQDTYSSLCEYNRQIGNYIDALRYADLEAKINKNIRAESQLLQLLGADKEFALEQKEKETESFYTQIYFWLTILIIIFISSLILLGLLFKLSQKHKKEINLQAKKYQNIKDQLKLMAVEYNEIEAEIASILIEDSGDNDDLR